MKWFLGLVACLILGAGLLVMLAIDDAPSVPLSREIDSADAARVHRLLQQNDPRLRPAGSVVTARLADTDVNTIAGSFLSRVGQAGLRVDSRAGLLDVDLAWPVRKTFLGRYVNVSAELEQADGLPTLAHLRVGKLPLPGPLRNWVYRNGIDWLERRIGMQLDPALLRKVTFDDTLVTVTYQWRPTDLGTAATSLVEPGLHDRILVYQDHLSAAAAAAGAKPVSLVKPLAWAMELAAQRSAENDPLAENRAALIAVAGFVNQFDYRRALDGAQIAPGRLPTTTLLKRTDSPQHWAVSAAIAALSNAQVAAAIGLNKEVEDADHGTGFSFVDLAADAAGETLGKRAVLSLEDARSVQSTLAAGVRENEIMPDALDFEENMTQPQFRQRYGSLDDERYKRVVAEIRRRVGQVTLLRGK